MNNEKRIDYFLQLIMVILGVFLGMMASDWNANKSKNKDRERLLIGLRSEIQGNLDYLQERKQRWIKPFFHSLDSLTKAIKTEPEILTRKFKNDYKQFPNFPGLGKRSLYHAMFEASKYSNLLSSFDIELLQQITKSYNLQENIENKRTMLDQKLVTINYDSRYEEVHNFMWNTMESYFGAQYNLIPEYQRTIKLINKHLEEI